MKVVCLNGPPRSGKDTVGEMMKTMSSYDIRVLKFAEPLKLAAHAISSLLHGEEKVESMEFYTDLKDEPNLDFFGATPRQAYISLSEDYCKKLFGEDIFGVAMAKKLKKMVQLGPPDIVVITDCGFQEEVDLVKDMFDTMVVRIERDGCSYESDSRNYLPNPAWCIHNNDGRGHLRVEVARLLAALEEDLDD